jgi:hypothetical protein
MRYDVEMASGGMYDIHTKFRKDRFRNSKIVRGGHRQTHTEQGDLISLLSLFQRKESWLKIGATTLHIFSHIRMTFTTIHLC